MLLEGIVCWLRVAGVHVLRVRAEVVVGEWIRALRSGLLRQSLIDVSILLKCTNMLLSDAIGETEEWSREWKLCYLRQRRIMEQSQLHLVGLMAWQGSCLHVRLEAHEGRHLLLFPHREGFALAGHFHEWHVC